MPVGFEHMPKAKVGQNSPLDWRVRQKVQAVQIVNSKFETQIQLQENQRALLRHKTI